MKQFILLLVLIPLLSTSCRYRGNSVRGSGRISTQQRSVSNFTGLETDGSIDIQVAQGDYKVEVEADENIQQYIETVVENGKLKVRFRNGTWLNHYNRAVVHVRAPVLNDFETHGSGNITGDGKIADAQRMNIVISGSGDIELNLDCPAIVTETHASGNITLSGDCKSINTKIFGSGNLEAKHLKSETANIEVHGSGDSEIFASESLDVKIYGSGDVRYDGSPKISSDIHGSGSVEKEE